MSVPEAPEGDVEIDFILVDPESDPLSVDVDFSLDEGRSWEPATLLDPDGAVDLESSPEGTAHQVAWNTLSDLGFRDKYAPTLRITPRRLRIGGSAHSVHLAEIDNLQTAIERVDHYMIHYGAFDPQTLALAKTYDAVMLHPVAGGLDAQIVREIKEGVDPEDPSDDVIVLAYISIGEDSRTVGVSDEEMLQSPKFVGDGTGPRVDPRGPDADGQTFEGIDLLGAPSPAGTAYASFYLDDNSVDQDPNNVGDGLPDRNAFFGGCFVNAGDPKWFDVLDGMEFDGEDGIPGMRELLTKDFGRGYDCDGLFLDTVDTCAPNSYTDSSSGNQSEFEWTAKGFADFMRRLKERYPRKFVLQNRGIFFFDPRHPHYGATSRPFIDLLKFESYRLNSNTFQEFDPYFFPDNKYNITPKLMAEANRPDGFRVFSLGYAEGPTDSMDKDTLIGASQLGFASLIEDRLETQDLAGFRHYITDARVVFPNEFVRLNDSLTDSDPPFWTSTFNGNVHPFPEPPDPPTPRVGIQKLQGGPGCLCLSWDVALDLNRVHYVAYYSTQALVFDAQGRVMGDFEKKVLSSRVGQGYENGVGPDVFANEATLFGLQCLTEYYVCLRAVDSFGHEDLNETTLSSFTRGMVDISIDGDFGDWERVPIAHVDPADVPDSAGPDWMELAITNDEDNLSIRYTSENLFNVDGSPTYGFSRTLIFIDIDDDPSTGYPVSSTVGSELLVSGHSLYLQELDQYNAGFLQELSMQPQLSVLECEFEIPLLQIDSRVQGASRIRLTFINDDVSDIAPDASHVNYVIIRP